MTMTATMARRTARTRPAQGTPQMIAILAVLGALVLGGLGAGLGALRGSAYSSEALVVVLPPKTGTTSDAIPIAAVWAQAAGTDAVLGRVAASLGVSDADLSAATTVTAVDGAPLVSIAVSSKAATTSARWANAVSDAVIAQSDAAPVSGFTLQSLTQAVPATSGASSLTTTLFLAGLVVGALAGVALAQGLARRPRRRRV